MKKMLFSVFIIALALVLLAQQDVLWSRLQFLDAPRVHVIQKGESLSRLAQKNYGDTDYWRELALINRAPKPDHIQPGEEVLLPASNVIQELRRARTISRVNDLINEQQALAVRSVPASPSTDTQSTQTANTTPGQSLPEQNRAAAEENTTPVAAVNSETAPHDPPRFAVDNPPLTEPVPSDDSGSWFWVIFGLLALGGVVGFVVYRRRQEEQELAHMQEEKFQANGGDRRKQDSRNFQTDRRPQASNQLEKAAV